MPLLGAADARGQDLAESSDETVLIALVENQGSRELVARVEAELSALGFRVQRLPRRQRETPLDLARRSGAVAVVAVRARDTSIELWGDDPDSGSIAFADVVPVDRARGKDVAAVAAAEALRGRLLRLGVTPQTRRSEVTRRPPPQPSPARAPATTAEPGARYGAFFGVGVGTGASDGLAPSAFMRVGAQLAPAPWLMLSVTSAWQPLPDELSAAEGEASVRLVLATLGADFVFGDDQQRWGLGPGLALAVVDMEGSASGGYRGRHDVITTVAAFAHGVGALRLVGPLHVRADAELGLALPRVVVRFADRDVASWGRPFALCTVGLDLLF